MYRVLVLIVNLVAALTIGNIFQVGVTFSIKAPQEVVAGTEFEVTVNIDKGDLESFSRLQQSFPAGLTAASSQSSNADFTFEEKRVRFIWLRMPRQDNFTVVYKIKVDERLKGTFNIDGKFSYIDQNERKSISMSSEPIQILPSPNIDPALIVDINDFEQQVIPYIPPAGVEPLMACIRQAPVKEAGGEDYIVNLLVNKETKQKFAKIEENIPVGFSAVSLNSKEAIFTFKNGVAKFLWMNLPSNPYFLVSYKLIPAEAVTEAPSLRGKFSYLEDEKTISIDIKQTDRDLTSIGPGEIPGLISSASTPQLAQVPSGTETVTPVKTPQEQAEEKMITKTTTTTPKITPEDMSANQSYMLEPESGIYYRVQLAAGHKKVDIQKYFKKYNLEKEVRREVHEGWQKYSVGSFPVYKEARDYRVHIWNTTVIDDAFVSAYNNGRRITVQEALMVANQEWYK
jgi:hypothetical protein